VNSLDPAREANASAASVAAGTEAPSAHAGTLAAAVRVVSFLTLISRFSGLVRDVVTARVFGDGLLGSSFRAAYAVPNLFRRLFGEGALSAAFLPRYTLLSRDEPQMAGQLASLTVRLLTLVTGVITIVVCAILGVLVWRSGADQDRSLSFMLMIVMLPMMPAVCLTAILGGMLQAHGRFGPPAAAPILLNLFQVIAAGAFLAGLIKDVVTAAYAVAGAALLASFAQVLWSWWALRGKVDWARAGHDARVHGRAVLSRFTPAMLGLGTLQLNTTLDMVIAMWPIWVGATVLGVPITLDTSSNAILSFTQTLYQFPLGVFGIAVATAVFPLLSRSADKPEEFASHLRRGVRLSLFIGLPASLGLLLVREEMVRVLFGGGSGKAGTGSFSEDGLVRSALVLAGFAPSIWAYSLNHVLTRAFYARGDTTTPMRLAIAAVVLNLSLNLVLVWQLGEAGLAWATGISAAIQCLALLMLVERKLGVAPIDAPTRAGVARLALASCLMGLGVWTVLWLLPPGPAWGMSLLRLAAGVIVGAGLYAALCVVMKLPELRWITQRAPRGAGGGAGAMSFD
jgi:putative peptidoglycan lipid II flippase